jgi:hypothetical protein
VMDMEDSQAPVVEEPESGDFTRKAAGYNQRLFSEPRNVELWLEFSMWSSFINQLSRISI